MISPDCAGLDKVRLHYDFPAVNCIICKEKKSISICFLKAVVEECCQEILFQLKYVTDSFWFFYPPLRAVMLLWPAARNHCCFSSSTWDALKGKSQPHIAILFLKKKINQCRKCYATWMLSRGKTKQEKVPFKQNALCSHLTIQHHNRDNAKANSRGRFELLWIHL